MLRIQIEIIGIRAQPFANSDQDPSATICQLGSGSWRNHLPTRIRIRAQPFDNSDQDPGLENLQPKRTYLHNKN